MLKKLRNKEELTDDEMLELVRRSPPGAFRTLPNLLTLGVTDLNQFVSNFREAPERGRRAFESGCYMEVLSLRLQHIDFWLRMFLAVKEGKRIEPTDKRTFGVILNSCKKLGFEPEIAGRLEIFNRDRNRAIHKYLLGATSYDGMRGACIDSNGIDTEVRAWVTKEIGVSWEVDRSG